MQINRDAHTQVTLTTLEAVELADQLLRCVGMVMLHDGITTDVYSTGAVDIIDDKPYPSTITFIVERQKGNRND
jgi:hypothetical protein